jgi:hypothetical protein
MYEELKILFKKYNLNINLKKNKINSKEEKNKEIFFSTKDFNRELLDLINTVYDLDFKLFNYNKF